MAVLSEPLHPSMGRLLLVKPESFFGEVVDGFLREGQSLRTEMIPEEIESLLDTPHSGLVGVLPRETFVDTRNAEAHTRVQ